MFISNASIFDHQGRRKYTNEAERRRFLACCRTQPAERRIFCLLLHYTGARISEALALRRDHIEDDAITLRSLKRRKEHWRRVPIPSFLAALLRSLPLSDASPDRLWTIHRTTAYRWVKTVMRQAQIRGPQACPKGVRHSFGMCAATCSVPPNLIQRWMGHARPETTAIYLNAIGAEEQAFAARMW